ncbi:MULTISPECIES: ABC transporter ATP-binding protein [unclassified Actinotalea]|uniref:ABC transporter ATP-binding protein n=1 Tax=unclassified Actinotalea TaxID=2638618 RepID=UPI0021021C44|nr:MULTISPECIES: ABC transporter ATP-binding protein [unclassified Actinotalea]
MPDDALLRLRGISRTFGTEVAVAGVDLTVRRGEVHALVGLNGAGKTTLMRLCLGMLRPDAGSAAVTTATGAVNAWRAPSPTWARTGHLVGVPFLYGELTVTEVIRSAALLRGVDRRDVPVLSDRIIDELELRHWADRRCAHLSTGNRQRVGLACAAVHRPELLVLDEPTNALDPAGVLVVRRWLQEARRRGTGVLVSSHHLDEVARVADRITVLHRGTVVDTLAPGAVDLERAFFATVYRAEASRTGEGVSEWPA